MTWDAYNRRRTALREIASLADRHRGLTPTELLDRVDPRRDAFADDSALLLDLQLAWYQRLSGECDRNQHDAPELVAVTAWANAASGLPGIRAVLDAHADHPALEVARAKERRLLAMSAGVSTGRVDDLVESARERADVDAQAIAEAQRQCPRTTLLDRLRSVIPA